MNWELEAGYWEKRYYELLELLEMVSKIIGNQDLNRSEYHNRLQQFKELVNQHMKSNSHAIKTS